jgi:hypothetical protein
MNLKRKDSPESREYWDYAERVAREVEAEIMKERDRKSAIWIPAMNGYVCRTCGVPRNWNGTQWANPPHATCSTAKE